MQKSAMRDEITMKVMYRLPSIDEIVILKPAANDVVTLDDYADIPHYKGFVFAPFSVDKDCPIVVFRAGKTAITSIKSVNSFEEHLPFLNIMNDNSNERQRYECDFHRFHEALNKQVFQKLVLARSEDIPFAETISSSEELGKVAETLFIKACRQYSEQFVCLVISPITGIWLMATPEILLHTKDGLGHTMALAGTRRRPVDGDTAAEMPRWSEKNIQEQQIVADYIDSVLRPYVGKIEVSKPRTMVAGRVEHLRTDFSFNLKTLADVGNLLYNLHPTPAVCGLPKDEARQFIMKNESHSRCYYSGFAGICAAEGDIDLFVSLRCMQIFPVGYRLYAGGGLLCESQVSDEWSETCAKMTTMKQLFE